MNIQAYSQGKKPNRNEDSWKNNRNTIVVADGATDKSGKLYGGKTGGEIISKLLVDKCIENDLTGIDLVESLTQTVAELYKKTNPTALIDPHYLFSSTLVYVRVTGSKLLITQIGDTSFRINGKKAFHNSTLLDKLTSNARVDYIKSTNDVDGGRDFIMPILKEQTKYQNNPDHILGYGCIDGTEVPSKFIKQFEFSTGEVETLEIFTDGYYAVPDGTDIADWEEIYKTIETIDPQKYLKYPSTKPSDDRTIVVAEF